MSEEVAAAPEAAAPAAPEAVSVSAVVGVDSPGEPTGEAAPESSWHEGMSPDDVAFVGLKGWPDNSAMLKSYRNLERLRGVDADKLAKIPDPENADEVAEFRAKMGVPEAADGYEAIEVNLSTGSLDPAMIQGISHAVGNTPEQHAVLASTIQHVLQSSLQEQEQATQARDAAEQTALDTEWGPAKDENYLAATKTAERFGLDGERLDAIQTAIGYRATMEMLTQIGRGLGEHKVAETEQSDAPFGLTRDVASRQRKELMADKGFRDRLFDGDVAAKSKWENLGKVINGV